MASETKEILKSDVVSSFENQLRGLKLVNGQLLQVYEPVLSDNHITSIISMLELYVNDIVKSSNMDDDDARRMCIAYHEELTNWFFLNWNEINPKRMTRDQIILGVTTIAFATWKCADKGSFRRDLFGHQIDPLPTENRPFR